MDVLGGIELVRFERSMQMHTSSSLSSGGKVKAGLHFSLAGNTGVFIF